MLFVAQEIQNPSDLKKSRTRFDHIGNHGRTYPNLAIISKGGICESNHNSLTKWLILMNCMLEFRRISIFDRFDSLCVITMPCNCYTKYPLVFQRNSHAWCVWCYSTSPLPWPNWDFSYRQNVSWNKVGPVWLIF